MKKKTAFICILLVFALSLCGCVQEETLAPPDDSNNPPPSEAKELLFDTSFSERSEEHTSELQSQR